MAEMPVFVLRSGTENPFDGINVSYRSTPTFSDIDGDGDFDLVVGSASGTLSYFEHTTAGFVERSGAANPFDGIDVGASSQPTFGDVDGDGDADLLVGERDGVLNYYENTGSGYSQRTGAANPFEGLFTGELSAPTFVDLDSDGDLDLFVGEKIGDYAPTEEFKYFERTAIGYIERVGTANPFSGFSSYSGGWAVPAFADFDGDGDLDLIRGTSTYIEPLFEYRARLNYYEQTNSGFQELSYLELQFNGFDSETHLFPAPASIDADGDGDSDLVIGIGDGSLIYFENLAPIVRIGTSDGETLIGAETNDTLDGKGGNDVLIGLAGADDLIGGTGIDTADYSSSTAGVTVRLHAGTASGGHAEGDTLTEIENAIGSQYADLLIGDTASNVLNGLAGDDILSGLAGADSLTGGLGRDTFLFVGNEGVGDVVTDYEVGDILYFANTMAPPSFGRSNADVFVGQVKLEVGIAQDTIALWSEANARTDVVNAALTPLGMIDLDALTALGVDLSAAIYDTDSDSLILSTVYTFLEGGASRLATITYDSGYSTQQWTDTGDLEAWADSKTGYTAAGLVDYVAVTFDNGFQTITDYDQDNVMPWTTKVTQSGGPLHQDNFVRVDEDNGRWQITFEDVGGLQPWTSRTNGYTADNRHDFTVLMNNDGTRKRVEFDRDDIADFSIREAHYDANGNIGYLTTIYDNGSRISRGYDPDDVYDWHLQTVLYDTEGRADWLRRDYDDGGYAVRDYDQTDAYAWDTRVREYDDNNILLSEEFIYA